MFRSLIAMFLLTVSVAWPAEISGDAAQKEILRARLVDPVEDPIQVRGEDGKTYILEVETENFHALHDPKLLDRLWEFEGRAKRDGVFEVSKMFTVKNGVRHKVTYYCEICHITSYRPGRCMCCQEDVALQETPVEK